VGSNVLVPLLKTTVLGDVVQVIPSDNDCSLHLGGHDLSHQNSTTDGRTTSEGALLVNVHSLNGLVGCLDAQTDVFHKAHGLRACVLNVALAGNENGILLLVRLFVLVALLVFLRDSSHL